MSEIVGYFAARTFTFPQIPGPLSFDVYLRLGPNKYTKVFSRGTALEADRLQTYILKGTQHFYIQNVDRLAFLNETVQILNSCRKSNLMAREESQQVLDELAEQTLTEIFQRHIFDKKTEFLTRTVVDTYVDIATQNTHVLPQLLALARKKPTLYKHMIMSSIFATLLAKAHDAKDNKLMLHCGYAAFVHDIGLANVAVLKDEHSMSLSSIEFAEIKRHPAKGVELLSQAPNVPDEVKTAVLQHHEGYDGLGYPKGLNKNMISLPARIVRIAEEFSSLIAGTEGSYPLPPSLAIHALARNPQTDPNLVNIFKQMLKL